MPQRSECSKKAGKLSSACGIAFCCCCCCLFFCVRCDDVIWCDFFGHQNVMWWVDDVFHSSIRVVQCSEDFGVANHADKSVCKKSNRAMCVCVCVHSDLQKNKIEFRRTYQNELPSGTTLSYSSSGTVFY